jgi:integrase
MSTKRTKLTKRAVEAIQPAAADQFLWDAQLPGFGLRIYPSGAKVYLYQWKRSGRTRRIKLGRHGEATADGTMGAELARKRAMVAAGQVNEGKDPAQLQGLGSSNPTIADLADLWRKEGSAQKRRSTLSMDWSQLVNHVLPLIGPIRLNALKRAHLERLVLDISQGKTRRDDGPSQVGQARARSRRVVRGGPGAAARALSVVGAMLEFAVARELRADNPARGVKKPKQQTIERMLSEAETVRLGDALRELEAEGMSWQPIEVVRLLLLTGCRRNEALFLRWEEVSFERARLELPRTKTGRSVRPLTSPALELLEKLRRQRDEAGQVSPWVFPSPRGEGPYIGVQKSWGRIRGRAGLDDVRLHDLRHNFASWAVAFGGNLYVVGKVLGHRHGQSTERYAHIQDDPARNAANLAATPISGWLEGPSAVTGAGDVRLGDAPPAIGRGDLRRVRQ